MGTSTEDYDFFFDCVKLQVLWNKSETLWIIYGFFWWDKNQKATINITKDDDKCFQDTATFTLNHKEIGKIENRYKTLSLL